jgi:hypothetical protein
MSELQTISFTDREDRYRDWHADYDSAFLETRPSHLSPLDAEADPFFGDFLSKLASNLSVSEVKLKEAIEATASELVGAMTNGDGYDDSAPHS